MVLLALGAYGQKKSNAYVEIDNRVLDIPSSEMRTTKDIAENIKANFKTDSDRVRAIYVWLASNIEYDVANMYALNAYESRQDKMAKALRTKKGICEHYAVLFNDLCEKCGVKSYIIGGYTKQNGRADYIPHAWTAARLDGEWFLFDPTWGSGYIDQEDGKFYKRLNNDFYRVPPGQLIKSHMPFDPMWEFLNYPVNNQEFYEGKTKQVSSKPYFSFTDSIAVWEQQDSATRLVGEIRRVEENGMKNSMIFDFVAHLKKSIEIEKSKDFNSAVYDYNEGVNNYNKYINYWNKQFRPMKPDNEIQDMFDAAYNRLTGARRKLQKIQDPGDELQPLVSSLHRSIDDLMEKVDEQDEWLKRYFGKKKVLRSTMFMKMAQ